KRGTSTDRHPELARLCGKHRKQMRDHKEWLHLSRKKSRSVKGKEAAAKGSATRPKEAAPGVGGKPDSVREDPDGEGLIVRPSGGGVTDPKQVTPNGSHTKANAVRVVATVRQASQRIAADPEAVDLADAWDAVRDTDSRYLLRMLGDRMAR